MNGPNSGARRTLTLPNNRGPKPFKPPREKRWNHQDELRDLIGKKIVVFGENGPDMGRLVEADQFTIKMAYEGPQAEALNALGSSSTITYFKHTIRGYALAVEPS